MPDVTELRIALTVADFEHALSLYRDALGLEQLADWTSDDGRVVVLSAGRATLELFDEAQADHVDQIEVGRRVSGPVRLAFEVADSEAMARRLVAGGAEAMAAPTTTPWGDRNARVRAPDGMQLTLFTSTFDPPPSVSAPVLRPAEPGDASAIAEIWWRGWRDGHVGHVPDALVAERTAASFGRRAERRLAEMTVAVIDERIAGFVIVVADEVEQVYVSARDRGAGVADALMAEAERRVRASGHTTAWLAVVAGNARARRFYERLGWSDGGPFDYAAAGETGPIAVPSHRYVKDL